MYPYQYHHQISSNYYYCYNIPTIITIILLMIHIINPSFHSHLSVGQTCVCGLPRA